ncbi:MAG: exodeoxyribonuclease VII small subunit [Raoultibacter sp.]
MEDETQQSRESFEVVKNRLDEIVETVNDESTSLDDALTLYEEAIKLGMQASNLLDDQVS